MNSSGVLDLDRHHRLEQRRASPCRMPSLNADRRRHLERLLVRVDVVVEPSNSVTFTSTTGIAREHAVGSVLEPLSTAGMYSRGTAPPLMR
jgi:hypothetical protein